MFKPKSSLKKLIIILALISAAGPVYADELKDGINLYKGGEYELSIRKLRSAAEKSPDDPEPHLWLSKCYEATFELDRSISETKIYNRLKEALKIKEQEKPKADSLTEKSESDIETVELKTVDLNKSTKVKEAEDNLFKSKNLLNDNYDVINQDFLEKLINSRKAVTVENKKPLELEQLMEIIDNSPKSEKELNDTLKKLDIKYLYGISSHEEEVLFKKSQADSVLLEISKLKDSKEQGLGSPRILDSKINKLRAKYEKLIYEFKKLADKPVYTYTDPLSFEYFKHLENIPVDIYLKDMDDKEKSLSDFYQKANLQIKVLENKLRSENDPEEIKNTELKLNNYNIEKETLEIALSKLDKTVKQVKESSKTERLSKLFSNGEIFKNPELNNREIDKFKYEKLREIKIDNGVNISSLVFGADGKTIVTAFEGKEPYNGEFKIWDMITGQEINRFRVDSQKAVSSMAISPDNKYLIIAARDQKVRVWDFEKNKEIKSFDTGANAQSLSISPDSRYLALIVDNKNIEIWDYLKAEKLNQFKPVNSSMVKYGPSLSLMASVSGKGLTDDSYELRIWDIIQGKEKLVLKHPKVSTMFSFNPNAGFIASNSGSEIKIWSLEGKEINSVSSGSGDLNSMNYSPDGKLLAASYTAKDKNSEIIIYDTNNKYSIQKKIVLDNISINDLIFSPDEKYLAGRTSTGSVIIWQL